MTTSLETGLPLNSNLSAADMRLYFAEAFIAVFDAAGPEGEDFSIQQHRAIAVRGNDGGLTLYAYDDADTVTASDAGLTTYVVSGRRYKRASETIVRDAVLSATTTAQPASPALGDAYVLTAAPSGTDWAAKAKNVATYTARGWVFRAPYVGQIVYAADTSTFLHYSAAGTWTTGIAAGGIGVGTIVPNMLANPFAVMTAEDERNAPPGSLPSEGTLYQVGTSPTGAFAGHAKAVARVTSGAYEFFAPGEGAVIYRRDVAALYAYRAGVWELAVPETGVARVVQLAQGSQTQTSISTTRKLYSATATFGLATGKTMRALVTGFRFDIALNTIAHGEVFELGLYKDTASTPNVVLGFITGKETSSGGPSMALFSQLGGSAVAADSADHTWQLGIRRVTGTGTPSLTLTSAIIWLEEVTL